MSRRVAHPPAHLGVEDGIIQHHHGLVLHGSHHFLHVSAGMVVIVAEEMGWLLRLDLRKLDDFFFLRGACASLLLIHELIKALFVYTAAPGRGRDSASRRGKRGRRSR